MACSFCASIVLEETMNNPLLRTPFGKVELRPVTAPAGAPEGMQTYELMPDLDELIGVPGFGLANPIRVRDTQPDIAPVSLLFH
jgi:hypothetical protein